MARKSDKKKEKVGFEKFEEIVKGSIGKRFSDKDLEQNRRDVLRKIKKKDKSKNG